MYAFQHTYCGYYNLGDSHIDTHKPSTAFKLATQSIITPTPLVHKASQAIEIVVKESLCDFSPARQL